MIIKKYIGQKRSSRLGAKFKVFSNLGFADFVKEFDDVYNGYRIMYFARSHNSNVGELRRNTGLSNDIKFYCIVDFENKRVLCVECFGDLCGDFDKKFEAAKAFFEENSGETQFNPSNLDHFYIDTTANTINPINLMDNYGIWPFNFKEKMGSYRGSRVFGDKCVWYDGECMRACAIFMLNI